MTEDVLRMALTNLGILADLAAIHTHTHTHTHTHALTHLRRTSHYIFKSVPINPYTVCVDKITSGTIHYFMFSCWPLYTSESPAPWY